MPHIHVYYAENDFDFSGLLITSKIQIRCLVAQWLGYESEQVALIAHPLSKAARERSDNLLRAEFVIESGKNTRPACTDESIGELIELLCTNLPQLTRLEFGVWVRVYFPSGFVQHTPKGST